MHGSFVAHGPGDDRHLQPLSHIGDERVRHMSEAIRDEIYAVTEHREMRLDLVMLFAPGGQPVRNLRHVAAEVADQFDDDCRNARIGCVDRKKALAQAMVDYLAPITERVNYYRQHQDEVRDIILEGSKRAREEAGRVMGEVRQAMKIAWV